MNDAELMKRSRYLLGITQQEMAEKMGYSHRVKISDVETGKRKLSGPAKKLLTILTEKKY